MSESAGEKTEQPSQRRLEEAWDKGQFAKSAEIQTVFVLLGALMALYTTGPDTWRTMADGMASILGKIHEIPIEFDTLQRHAIQCTLALAVCVLPVLIATSLGGLLAGGFQSRFRTASEALAADWQRINPVSGFSRIFSLQSLVPTGFGIIKLSVVGALSYNVIQDVLSDPIFFTVVDLKRIAAFMAESAFRIILRVGFALVVIATADYGYQLWKTHKDMMMTRQELTDEQKNQEGNPQVKSAQRRRRQAATKRKMLAEIPKADVVLTNPTHLAVALRYDRKSMKAPRIVAKGSRLNALQIREIARAHQVPVIENKPLARLLFRHVKVGGEIPAQLYAAVAEILAYVYRINAYRYYREQQSG
jgi:flagellar biosynthetic protein FlhB